MLLPRVGKRSGGDVRIVTNGKPEYSTGARELAVHYALAGVDLENADFATRCLFLFRGLIT